MPICDEEVFSSGYIKKTKAVSFTISPSDGSARNAECLHSLKTQVESCLFFVMTY